MLVPGRLLSVISGDGANTPVTCFLRSSSRLFDLGESTVELMPFEDLFSGVDEAGGVIEALVPLPRSLLLPPMKGECWGVVTQEEEKAWLVLAIAGEEDVDA